MATPAAQRRPAGPSAGLRRPPRMSRSRRWHRASGRKGRRCRRPGGSRSEIRKAAGTALSRREEAAPLRCATGADPAAVRSEPAAADAGELPAEADCGALQRQTTHPRDSGGALAEAAAFPRPDPVAPTDRAVRSAVAFPCGPLAARLPARRAGGTAGPRPPLPDKGRESPRAGGPPAAAGGAIAAGVIPARPAPGRPGGRGDAARAEAAHPCRAPRPQRLTPCRFRRSVHRCRGHRPDPT